MPYLTDDGTLDTVIRCECGREHRYSYEPADETDTDNDETTTGYDDFVADCVADVESSCDCLDKEQFEAEGPNESDITTTDHRNFYQDGRLVLTYNDDNGRAVSVKDGQQWSVASMEQAVKHYMVHTQFWPNCWFISDHGNAHLMDLGE